MNREVGNFCNDDPVCSMMSELPEKYVSTSTNPCRYTDEQSKKQVVCEFSDFKSEDGDATLENETVMIDAMTFNLGGLDYLDTPEVAKCSGDIVTELGIELDSGLIYASHALHMEMVSPDGTRAIVKPLYCNWYYAHSDTVADTGTDDLPLSVSTFCLEPVTESEEKRFSLILNSVCNLDLDSINKYMNLSIYGYGMIIR